MATPDPVRNWRRGDVVVCALPGDYGKPRPAVVVQSDLFNATHGSVSLCPITSTIVDAPLFRITILSDQTNGLKVPSQVMVDKITALRSGRIQGVMGRLTASQLELVDEALRLWLGLD